MLNRNLSSNDEYAPRWSRRGRVTRNRPCPACNHASWCEFDENENWLLCMRPDKAVTPLGWIFIKISEGGGQLYKSERVPIRRDQQPIATATDLIPVRSLVVATNNQQPDQDQDELKHNVYTDLLAALELTTDHHWQLTNPHGKRQLSEAEVTAISVRSIPESQKTLQAIIACLEAKYGSERLLNVPGFFLDKKRNNQLRLNAGSGAMLIPSRDYKGKLTGLRVAPDKSYRQGTKYYWLSSANKGGQSATAKASLWLPVEAKQGSWNQIGVTEGEFKAFIAAQRFGHPFISVPGVSTWQSAGTIDMASEIVGLKGKISIYYDADSSINQTVERSKYQLADALVEAGLNVEIASWPLEAGKGIDDLLLAQGIDKMTSWRHVPGLPGLKVDRVIGQNEMIPVESNGETRYYLPDVKLNKKVTLVRAYKGGGKTEMIRRLLTNPLLPNYVTAMSIIHRVALSHEQSRRWEMDLYQNFKAPGEIDQKGLTLSKRLAICVDSLKHLLKAEIRNYIIIDEIEQVLKHLTANTLRKRRKAVLAMLRKLIERAEHVIALDADLGPIAYSFFERIVGASNIEIIFCDYVKQDAPPILAYSDLNRLTAAALTSLKEGKRIYMATNSRQEALRLQRLITKQLPQLKGLTITQDNSADPFIRKMLTNLAEQVHGYDYLIASPTLGTGIDLSTDHFQETFLVGKHNSTTHSDLLQHAARNRRAQVIHTYVAPGEKAEPTSSKYWADYCLLKAEETGLLLDEDHKAATGQRLAQADELDYLELWADIKAAEKRSSNHLAANFYEQAQREGHRVTWVDQPGPEPGQTAPAMSGDQAEQRTIIKQVQILRREARQELKAERLEAILAASDITYTEYKKLDEKGYRTTQEAAQWQRYRLKDYYGLDITPELIEFDDEGRLRGKLAAFMDYIGKTDPAERDRAIAADPEQMLPDGRHYTAQKQLRIEVLTAAKIEATGQWCSADLARAGFIDWAKQNADRLYRVLGITLKSNFDQKPIELLATVFGQLGVRQRLEKRGQRGHQTSYYKLDQEGIARMQMLAEARHQQVEKLKAQAVTAAPVAA